MPGIGNLNAHEGGQSPQLMVKLEIVEVNENLNVMPGCYAGGLRNFTQEKSVFQTPQDIYSSNVNNKLLKSHGG